MGHRYFNVAIIGGGALQACLNMIRWLANPKEKEPAHITFQGPFTELSDARASIPELPIGKDAALAVVGAGSFFNDRQNTVFLQCSSLFLSRHWKKATAFKVPHVTLYDGDDRDLAQALLNSLLRYPLNFTARIESLETIESIKGQSKLFLELDLEKHYIERITGRTFSDVKARIKDVWFRDALLERVCSNLEFVGREVDSELRGKSRKSRERLSA